MEFDLSKKANEIIEKAKNMGVEQNFLFMAQFKQYTVLINTLSKLEEQIKEEDLVVKKEYVKGRKNLYANPLINEYVKVGNSANNTALALLKIITGLTKDKIKDGNEEKKKNPLLDILNG